MKDKTKGIFPLILKLLKPQPSNRKSGFTIAEVLVAAFILGLIFAALFQVLNVGQLANIASSERTYLQSEVRRAMDWIVRDVRQSLAEEMGEEINEPSVDHIKFKKVWRYDIINNEIELDGNSIEYAYNADTHIIKRRRLDAEGNETGNPSNWTFYNITEAPFYTRNIDTGVISPLDATGIRPEDNNLVVNITGRRIRGALNLTLTLQEEVRIRNQ